MKKIDSIGFNEIPSIPQLIKDFLGGGNAVFSDLNFNRKNFERAISERSSFGENQRALVAGTIQEQFQGLQLSQLQQEHLNHLRTQSTFTVVTGHQLNLFTGPAFFIYKVLQTIKTADWLAGEFPEYRFVPVFWMATEDHDFEEINHFRTQHNVLRTKAAAGGPVGRIVIEDVGFISEFEAEFKNTVFGTEMVLWMKEAYQVGRNLADATRILVHRIFSEYGLLILDGDDSALKTQMTQVFSDELQHGQLESSTAGTVALLRQRYGAVQVNPRSINLFYLNEKRERIDRHGAGFMLQESGHLFSEAEMLDELIRHPEKFSPNALMRPVYQETVLPNVAYIGGNAEIMYWLELQDYFKHLQLPFPVLIPRNSMVFLPAKTLKKMEKSVLGIPTFFKDFPKVLNGLILKESTIVSKIEHAEKQVADTFETLKQSASETDKTFGHLVDAEEKRQLKSLEKMRRRLLRAEKIKHAEKIAYLENLYLEVHPGKNWQERVLNFSVFYADLGADWLKYCYGTTDPEKSNLIITEI